MEQPEKDDKHLKTLRAITATVVATCVFCMVMILLLAKLSHGEESANYPPPQYGHSQPAKSEFTHNLEAVAHNTEAAQGINNVYALVTALTALAALVVKEFKDGKNGKRNEELFERTDAKFNKLFSYTDGLKEEQKKFEGRISSLETSIKGIETITKSIEAINKELKDIQLTIKELLTLQKMEYELRKGKNG